MGMMTAQHMSDDEPQRVYNFYLEIDGLSSTTMHVEQVRMPTFGTAVLKERYFNEDIKVAGAAIVGDNQIVVRDTVKDSAYKELIAWSKEVHDPADGKIGFATAYKRQGNLLMTAPDGSMVKTIVVKGVWPQTIAGSELSYGPEAGDVKIQCVFQVDKYILDGV